MKGLAKYMKDPTALILSILVVLSVLGALAYVKDTPGLDYYVAWVAADSVESGKKHNIYKRATEYKLAVIYRNKADENKDAPRQKQMAAHRKTLPMTATPFLYWVTAKLATGNYEKDLTRWSQLSIFLVTISILLMCRVMGYSAATSLTLLLPVLVWFAPFHSDLRVANVNGLQLGMLGLIFWLQSRGNSTLLLFLTGLLIGLLVMFKPNLGPVAVLVAGAWLLRKQYKKRGVSLSGMTLGATAAILVSSWWMSSTSAWFDWLNVLRKVVARNGPGESGGNYAAVTKVVGGISPINQFGLALILCAVCLIAFWWGRRGSPASGLGPDDEHKVVIENTVFIAMGCIVAMLASSIVWLHYYLLIVPMLIVLFRPWAEPGRIKIIPMLMSRVLPALVLASLLDSALQGMIGINPKTYWATVTMSSTTVLFVIGLWQFTYGIRDQLDRK
jgi:hypothetical protein